MAKRSRKAAPRTAAQSPPQLRPWGTERLSFVDVDTSDFAKVKLVLSDPKLSAKRRVEWAIMLLGPCPRCRAITNGLRRILCFEPEQPRSYGAPVGMFRNFFASICGRCSRMTAADAMHWVEKAARASATAAIGAPTKGGVN